MNDEIFKSLNSNLIKTFECINEINNFITEKINSDEFQQIIKEVVEIAENVLKVIKCYFKKIDTAFFIFEYVGSLNVDDKYYLTSNSSNDPPALTIFEEAKSNFKFNINKMRNNKTTQFLKKHFINITSQVIYGIIIFLILRFLGMQ